ncbi:MULTISPECIES: FIST N-terminal domain-containing protein [unclassified Limnothrix]|uniref:FIST signal transduction protein n=1 Tax=unclassified Limnothrix TaxID=2632864 RepID=UPI001F54ABA6|nr:MULTISPECIES: FIST N-terminal domain-containing protein [unclassified Limnothrix]
MSDQMKWVSAVSKQPSLEAAIDEVSQRVLATLGQPPDLLLVFISSAFSSEYARLMPLLRDRLPARAMAGCGGSGVVGNLDPQQVEEVEDDPALCVMAAWLPNVTIQTFHIDREALPDLDGPPQPWIEAIGADPATNPNFLVFADPGLVQMNDLLQGLDYAYPGSVTVGGLASGDSFRETKQLFADYRAYRSGAVGVALSGDVVIEPIVAQGCRPIGQPLWVTECERNIVMQVSIQMDKDTIADKPQAPLKALRQLIEELSDKDRELAQYSLFVGLARDAFRQTLEPGDFLIRNLLGVDPSGGAIAIGDRIRRGQRIQFHLRDADTSAEDLRALLERYLRDRPSEQPDPIGALMFACVGRGQGLYNKANFDSCLLQKYLGLMPVAGFFCNGEIGPVGGTTFIHGYTSVFALFRPKA